jgi:predicted metalloprotease with PDZ domain
VAAESIEIPAEPEATEPDPRMSLDVSVEESGRLVVRHHLPLAWVGRALPDLCLAFDDTVEFDNGPNGYGRFIRSLTDDGAESDFEACRPSVDSDIDTTYAMLPEHEAAHATHGLEDAPHSLSRGLFLIGRAFVPAIHFDGTHGLDMPVDVTFHLPEHWTLVASHDLDGSTLHAESVREAQDVVFEVGRLSLLEESVSETRLRVVSGDYSERELAPLLDLGVRTLRLGQELLGPLPSGEILATFDRAPEGLGGGRIGDAVSLTSDRPPEGTALSPSGRVLVHELMHLWIAASDAYWLHEGMTRYLELMLRIRVDELSEPVALSELMRIYGRYRQSAGVRRIEDAMPSMGGWPYEAGAVLAFCADTELRHQQTDLFPVLRDARRRVGRGRALDRASFMAALEQASPEVTARVRGWLAHQGPIDFGACLERAGYGLRGVTFRDITPEGEGVVLRASNNLAWPATVGRPRAASGFSRGDRLLSLNGERLASLHELGWALRGASLGDRLRFRVRRSGRVRVVVQRSPDLERFARRGLRYVAVIRQASPRPPSPLRPAGLEVQARSRSSE